MLILDSKSETEPSTPENIKPESTTTSETTNKVDFRSIETLSKGAPLIDSQRLNQSPENVKNLKRNLKCADDDNSPKRKRRKQTDGNTQPNQAICHCEFCGKGFTRQWLLQGHIRTHSKFFIVC